MPQVKNAFYVHGNSVVEFKPDKTVRIDDYFLVNNQTKTKVIGLLWSRQIRHCHFS